MAAGQVDVETMRWLVANHTEAGFSAIFLWGFEWWYDVKERKKDRKCGRPSRRRPQSSSRVRPLPASRRLNDAAAAKGESNKSDHSPWGAVVGALPQISVAQRCISNGLLCPI